MIIIADPCKAAAAGDALVQASGPQTGLKSKQPKSEVASGNWQVKALRDRDLDQGLGSVLSSGSISFGDGGKLDEGP